jgi:hypothetical protein
MSTGFVDPWCRSVIERRRHVLPFFFHLPLQLEIREAKIAVAGFLLVDQVMRLVQTFDGKLQDGSRLRGARVASTSGM